MNVHTLRDLAQVKAMADPTRMRILRELARQPLTAMKLAKLLGEKTTKIYHHVEALESAGLIVLVESKQNRGFIEKWYRAIADDFAFDSQLLALHEGPGGAFEGFEGLFISSLEAALNDARQSAAAGVLRPKAGETAAVIYRLNFRCRPDQLQEIMNKLAELAESTPGGENNGRTHSLTLALHPVAHVTEESQP